MKTGNFLNIKLFIDQNEFHQIKTKELTSSKYVICTEPRLRITALAYFERNS